VICDQGCTFVSFPWVERFECLRHPGVQRHPPRRELRAIGDLLGERVVEGKHGLATLGLGMDEGRLLERPETGVEIVVAQVERVA
jgi:hypothetical protein